MTRIVTPEEAQRLLDTPTSIPGSPDWDYSCTNTYLANFIDAGPDLARTVVQQAAQIERLQHAVDHAIYHDVRSVEDVTATGIITAKDIQP